MRRGLDFGARLCSSSIAISCSVITDRVVRHDPKTGNAVQYLMPSDTNMRTVFVDNTTTPVTFWVGSNHDHRLVKVEPLD